MCKHLGISLPYKALNIYVPSADDLSADHDSSRPEEAPYAGPSPLEVPSAGPSNYSHLEVPSAGPSTSSYPHFDQPPPSPCLEMGHLETPYPDMPGRYSPTAHFPPLCYDILDSCQQPPVEDQVLADPYYPQDQVLQSSYPPPPMPGGYSTTSTGEDVLAGFGELENFASSSWNTTSYY